MRLLVIAAVLAFSFEAAAQGVAGEFNVARPGAAYMSAPAADSEACARRCADDGLCMAWTFQTTNACELHANVSAPISSPGAYSGLSQRAPAFARTMVVATPVATPVKIAATIVTPPAGEDHAAATPRHEEAPDVAELLGGPEEGDLRTGLNR